MHLYAQISTLLVHIYVYHMFRVVLSFGLVNKENYVQNCISPE